MSTDEIERRDLRGMRRRLRQDVRAARRLGDVITIFIPSILVESGVRKPADGQGASTGDLEGRRPQMAQVGLTPGLFGYRS
jgi:hypothetical protein